ncbi:MAG: 16S rRNA (cytosine(967)-C(5))-methyltransferase RsmB [Candidatus Eisenbacteria bacterium]|nr:16S rRNA (cytosine(967)-C(5))-methyltransferase RsmB [Candidatus Eisenbacteria bacterium]
MNESRSNRRARRSSGGGANASRPQGRPPLGPQPRPTGGSQPRRPGGLQPRPPRGPQPRPQSEWTERGQAGAINRSRPIYENNGRGSGATRGGWNGTWRRDRARQRDGGRGAPSDSRGREARGRDARPGDRSLAPLPPDPREAALRILLAVDTRSAFSDRLLDGAHARGGPEPRDQALMHELVKGTLRWRGRIDWILDRMVHIGLAQVQPWARNALRIGAYQILFLDRIPAHAAVDESVKLVHKFGHPGTAGLVNSVLRRLCAEKDTIQIPEGDDAESLAVWGSHPRWMVERWLRRFGPDRTRALMLANNRPVRSGLRVNPLRGTRAQLIQRLASEGATTSPAALSPDLLWLDSANSPAALAAFKQGWCTVQDESEALVGRLVDPKPHERLLDLCAAPGGKCTHLAELMGDEGEVWAMERDAHRVATLAATVERLGMHGVHVVQGDGRDYAFPMPFDRVLVDAPCSGLGVLGRRADARWRKGPEVLREMAAFQLELLAAGGRRARPGGVLVYSVCSFEPEETTELIEKFLRQASQFVLESARGVLPDAVVADDGCMHVLPHIHGCDGAFAARFRRT